MLVSSGSSASASARIRIEPKIISGSQPSTLRTPILIPSARSDTTCYSQFEPARNFVTGKAVTPRLVAGQTRMSHRISNDTPRKLPADSSSQCSQSRSCLKDPPGRDRAADGPEWDAPLPRLNDLLFAFERSSAWPSVCATHRRGPASRGARFCVNRVRQTMSAAILSRAQGP